MIKSRQDEDLIVRWAFAEIIRYIKEKSPRSSYYTLKYLSPSKVHKILYKAFDASDVPVTRSWFRYGCFIHSNQLDRSKNFSALKSSFAKSENPASRLESRVAELGIQVKLIREKLYESYEDMPRKFNEYLRPLYLDAPKGLSEIYLAKLDLYDTLRRFQRFNFQSPGTFGTWLSEVRRNISAFHMAAFSRSEFNDLVDIVLDFTSKAEEALLKTEELVRNHQRILQKQIKVLLEFHKFFDQRVWLPFALEISRMTVKGLREEEVKARQSLRKKKEIKESLQALEKLSRMLVEHNLTMSWDRYNTRLKSSSVENTIKKTISEMEEIYEKSTERE